jgi:hypothetical protein
VTQAPGGAGQWHGQEQAGDDRVALVGHNDDGAPSALLTASEGSRSAVVSASGPNLPIGKLRRSKL